MGVDEDTGRKAMETHARYKGKVDIGIKVPIKDLSDFNYIYTPGVAEPSREIASSPESAYELTNKGNSVAILTDGSRILGLGNLGPAAALPVMEGKALLFKYLGGVDAFPLCVQARTTEELADVAKKVAPSFGGINMEDVESPKCFEVYDLLIDSLDIPVFHDDRQGTATVVLAGLINSLKVVGKKLSQVSIVVVGAGAGGLASTRLLLRAGASGRNVVVCDSRGPLYEGRDHMDKYKNEVARLTNAERLQGTVETALRGVDVMICLSRPGPWIPKEWVAKMAGDAIVFALANPTPEIWPEDAIKGGARVVATGRSDFPNQINNSLAFPSIFRGMLEVRARRVNDEMLIAASKAIANWVEPRLGANRIVPTMDETEVFVKAAIAVANAAMDTGVARIKPPQNELRAGIERKIHLVREKLSILMERGLI